MPRAALRVGHRSLALAQLDLAVAAGFERLVVLAHPNAAGLHRLVQEARGERMAVTVIADALDLCRMVTAADEVLVLREGLICDPALALPVIERSQVITVFPVGEGLAAGFERIDAELCDAGLLVLPGALVERLRQLPRDYDVASALLRLALIAGIPRQSIDTQAIGRRQWLLIADDAGAQAVEAGRLARSLEEASQHTPGPWLAALAVRRFGGALFDADRSSGMIWGAAALSALAGCAMALSGWFAIGLVLMALAWLNGRAAAIIDRAEQQGRPVRRNPERTMRQAGLVFDLALVAVLTAAGSRLAFVDAGGWSGALAGLFAPIVLIAGLRIAAQEYPIAAVRSWMADRFLLTMVAAAAAIFGMAGPAMMIAAVVLLCSWAALLAPRDGPAGDG